MFEEYKLSGEDKARCSSLAHLGYSIDPDYDRFVEKQTTTEDLKDYPGPVIRIGSTPNRPDARILYGFYQGQPVWLEFQPGAKNQTKIYLNDGDEFNEIENVDGQQTFKTCQWFYDSMETVKGIGKSKSRGLAGRRKVVAIYFLAPLFGHLAEDEVHDLLLDVAHKAGFVERIPRPSEAGPSEAIPQYVELVPKYRPRLLPHKPPTKGTPLRQFLKAKGIERLPLDSRSQTTTDPSEPQSHSAFDVLWNFTMPTPEESSSAVANSSAIVSNWLGREITSAALMEARNVLPFDSNESGLAWMVGWWAHESIDCMDLGNIMLTNDRMLFEATYAGRQQRWKGDSDSSDSGTSETLVNPTTSVSTDETQPQASLQAKDPQTNTRQSTNNGDPVGRIIAGYKRARTSYIHGSPRSTSSDT